MAQLKVSTTNYGLVMTEFSKKLTHYRKIAGLSQTTLAKKIGITPTQISKYERGVAEPKPETLKKIAEALDVTIDKLLPEESKPQVYDTQLLDSLPRLSVTAKGIKNGIPNVNKTMDCYLSLEADKDFINEARNFFYNYVKNRFGDDYDMTEILRTYSLVDIKLKYKSFDDNNSN